MNKIFSILIIVVSILIFVFFVVPKYKYSKEIRETEKKYITALNNFSKLQITRDKLIEKKNSISESDLERINKMIPSNTDNVKLILELQTLASQHGLSIKTADAQEEEDEDTRIESNIDIISKDYGIIKLDFEIEGTYEDFVDFLADIERSLRVIDIDSLSFNRDKNIEKSFIKNNYTYRLSIKTYWLKDSI